MAPPEGIGIVAGDGPLSRNSPISRRVSMMRRTFPEAATVTRASPAPGVRIGSAGDQLAIDDDVLEGLGLGHAATAIGRAAGMLGRQDRGEAETGGTAEGRLGRGEDRAFGELRADRARRRVFDHVAARHNGKARVAGASPQMVERSFGQRRRGGEAQPPHRRQHRCPRHPAGNDAGEFDRRRKTLHRLRLGRGGCVADPAPPVPVARGGSVGEEPLVEQPRLRVGGRRADRGRSRLLVEATSSRLSCQAWLKLSPLFQWFQKLVP